VNGGNDRRSGAGFVRKRWNPFVFNQKIIDRRFYELAVMTELKNGLRAGDNIGGRISAVLGL
jgi:hypothetical protein